MKKNIYPLGVQTFQKLRDEGLLYVDKTELVYNLVNTYNCVFLSRPRRFGKSLLLSTIKEYFEGNRDLFKGLAIESLEKEWKTFPVIRFDLSTENYDNKARLISAIGSALSHYEDIYGRRPEDDSIATRFRSLIMAVNQRTSKQVVVLIDEYDKPLLQAMNDSTLQDDLRDELKSFYGVLKSCDEYIRFSMLTGVSRFSHVTVFSGLNNLVDISMNVEYSDICGISESEFERYFGDSISTFADYNQISVAEAKSEFKENYDGYHFTRKPEGLYNPWSVMSAFDEKEIGNYWFRTGTPTFLVDLAKSHRLRLLDIESPKRTREQLSDLVDPDLDVVPLLFQAGFLTIKDYDPKYRTFTLGFPNLEVKNGFWNFLYNSFIDPYIRTSSNLSMREMASMLFNGEVDGFMESLQSIVAKCYHGQVTDMEVIFQNNVATVFTMLGFDPEVEVPSSVGFSDLVVKTHDYIYVFEFKVDSTPQKALDQIIRKGYAAPYAADRRQVFLVGANFSKKEHCLKNWIVLPLQDIH